MISCSCGTACSAGMDSQALTAAIRISELESVEASFNALRVAGARNCAAKFTACSRRSNTGSRRIISCSPFATFCCCSTGPFLATATAASMRCFFANKVSARRASSSTSSVAQGARTFAKEVNGFFALTQPETVTMPSNIAKQQGNKHILCMTATSLLAGNYR